MGGPQRIGKTREESEIRWPQSSPVAEGRTNVVVILLDDVGFGQIGCYGSSIRTPNIDALAAEGIRYSAFHTTALCSPTRAALLTGRNHHSCGMASIPQLAMGYPGHNAVMPREHGMLSEILRDRGYNTFAVGKWHLTPDYEQTPAGPFDRWPLGRGFERFYGFLMGMIDHWHPGALAQDNQFVDRPGGNGYHLSVDLTDRAIQYLAGAHSANPAKPFFLYLAYGAGHSPHHVPLEYADAYRGVFDEGWDAERQRVLDRQKQLGLMPESVGLPERNWGVAGWDTLSDDQRRLYTRMQEVYAGFITHTDHQIGRVVEFLRRIGRLDDTMIVFLSDNGASLEGQEHGIINEYAMYNALFPEFSELLEHIDRIGGPGYMNHYPRGWSMAGNTPFREWKRSVWQGGIADPFIIRWPDRIRTAGEIRRQYHHVTDVMPTILEALDIEPPSNIGGVPQSEIEGVSMWYSVLEPDSESRKQRAVLRDAGTSCHLLRRLEGGGRSCAHEQPGQFQPGPLVPLQHGGRSQRDHRPVRESILTSSRTWLTAGGWRPAATTCCPSTTAGTSAGPIPGPQSAPTGTHSSTCPIPSRSSPGGAVNTLNRDFDIVTTVSPCPSGVTEGVIFAHGNRFGGYTLFVKHGEVRFVYNLCGIREYRVTAPLPAGDGPVRVSVIYKREADHRGSVRLVVGEAEPVKGRIGHDHPLGLPRPQQSQLRPGPRPVRLPGLRGSLRLHGRDRQSIRHRRGTRHPGQSQDPRSRTRRAVTTGRVATQFHDMEVEDTATAVVSFANGRRQVTALETFSCLTRSRTLRPGRNRGPTTVLQWPRPARATPCRSRPSGADPHLPG